MIKNIPLIGLITSHIWQGNRKDKYMNETIWPTWSQAGINIYDDVIYKDRNNT